MAAYNDAGVANDYFERMDEYEWEVEHEIAEDIAEMAVKAIIEAGKFLKLKVDLDGEAKLGDTWAAVH